MLRKYNIALVPTDKGEDVIKCARYFSKIADQYQLGENSLPHVTLCQFQANENEIEQLWSKTCEALSEHSIQLVFKDFSCITFNNTIFWVSLMPDHRVTLNKMHQIVANTIKSPINKTYDPHMTLINTKYDSCKEMVNELERSYSPILDNFVLAIGECDSIGQFTKLIHKSSLKKAVKGTYST